jgi:hypothetical protein
MNMDPHIVNTDTSGAFIDVVDKMDTIYCNGKEPPH